MKKPLDWKALGQFVSVLVNLFAVIRNTLSGISVDLAFIGWLCAEGKESFIKTLTSLGQEYLATQRVRVIKPGLIIEVNLEAKPRLPFDGATVEKHEGEGWVRVEKRPDGLYINGKKVVLYLSEKQQNGEVIQGHNLREELSGRDILNANILDALLEYLELIPEDWKKDAKGNARYIFFWATVYRRDPDGYLFVRCLFWDGDRWYWGYHGLGDGWFGYYPSAVRAS